MYNGVVEHTYLKVSDKIILRVKIVNKYEDRAKAKQI